MAYSHTTWTQLQQKLALRLSDTANTYWTTTEIPLYLAEALRTFGLLSGFWRQRGTIQTVAATFFYDIAAGLVDGSAVPLLSYTVTDRDIIQQIQFALLESASTQASWPGTEMFTYNDIVEAIQRRLNQFLSDTGIVVTPITQSVTAASITAGRQTIDDRIIDVRRVAWLGTASGAYTNLWREDERLLVAASESIAVATPEFYALMATPPLTLMLAPPPNVDGTLSMLVVETGVALNPAMAATALGIPDDLTPAIKWGALADLLGKDGLARDPARAAFCESRYKQYVDLARLLPVVVSAQINGISQLPATISEMDAYYPGWQNTATTTPTDILLCGANTIAMNPLPSGVNTLTIDVVQKAPVPTSGATQVQVGREQLDMILDYAEHLALFKVGGDEWHATFHHAQNFLMQSATYNQRVAAAARAVVSAHDQSQREKENVKRRSNQSASGIGAMNSDPQSAPSASAGGR